MNRESVRQKTADVFNAAADYFDDPALSFWHRFGQNTIGRLQLQPGNRVLDVCCGTGASAIPAALKVGRDGSVVGVDLAESLLKLARQKAEYRGLENTEFRCGDFNDVEFADESFDAIVCVFGIFFLPEMETAIAQMWRMLRPGGKLAITSWGTRVFEPANQIFWNAIASERPDLYKQFTPWYRIGDADSLKALLEAGGATQIEIFAEVDRHPLATPTDWWTMAMGGGLRGTIDKLDVAVRERVKSVNLEFLSSNQIQFLDSDVLYAIAQKSQTPTRN